MKDQTIKLVKNKKIKNPDNIPLLLDVILVLLPFTVPHPGLPYATVAIIKILICFHLLGKKEK